MMFRRNPKGAKLHEDMVALERLKALTDRFKSDDAPPSSRPIDAPYIPLVKRRFWTPDELPETGE